MRLLRAIFDQEKPAPRTLMNDSMWSLAGTGIFTLGQWMILVITAKWDCIAQIGEFAIASAICNPIFFLLGLQLRSLLATDQKGESAAESFIQLRILLSGLGLALLSVAALCGFSAGARPSIFTAVALMRCCDSNSDIFYGLAQQRHHIPLIACSQAIRGLLAAAVVWPVMWLTEDLGSALAFVALAWLLVIFVFDFRMAKTSSSVPLNLFRTLDRPSLIRLLQLGIPMGVILGLVQLIDSVPRFFIERYLGLEDLGAFAAMIYLLAAGRMLTTAVGQSALPRLASYYASARWADFTRLVWRLEGFAVALGSAAILTALLIGEVLLEWIYSDQVAARSNALPWIMGSSIFAFAGTFLGQALTAARRIKGQLYVTFLMLVVEIGASWYLVPRLQLIGAALAITAAGATQCIAFCLMLVQSRSDAKSIIPVRHSTM